MKLSAKQRELLDALPPRRRAFVLELELNGGNQTQAAIAAGYSEESARAEGSRLMTYADVIAAVEALRVPAENRKYRGVEQLREWWSSKMDSAAEDKDQLKASELLAKSQGGLVDKQELSGAGGGPVQFAVVLSEADADELAGEGDE